MDTGNICCSAGHSNGDQQHRVLLRCCWRWPELALVNILGLSEEEWLLTPAHSWKTTRSNSLRTFEKWNTRLAHACLPARIIIKKIFLCDQVGSWSIWPHTKPRRRGLVVGPWGLEIPPAPCSLAQVPGCVMGLQDAGRRSHASISVYSRADVPTAFISSQP